MNKYFGVFFAAALCLCVSFHTCADEPIIPRFVSLKNDKVNLRTGPGERYPIMWVYTERKYPVEVIDEYELWRQIREVDGTTGWVHRTQINNMRHALILEEDRMMNKPTSDSKTVAIVQKGTIGRILKCPAKSDFCMLDFNGVRGWMRKSLFYGVYPDEVID